jgi:type I restriction enzyme S subunit
VLKKGKGKFRFVGMNMRIGNVAKVQGGYAFKSSEFISKGTPIIRIGNLDGEKVLIDTNICYPEKFWEEHQEFRINKGDILVAMSGATVGKIGLYNYEDKALLNQRVGNILPKKNIIREYLYYYCMSPAFRRNIEEKAFGCAQPNISTKQIEDFNISIPSIEEQEKAVKIFEKTYSIIRNRKQQLEEFDSLIKSRFIEMFGDLKSNSKQWKVLNFDEFARVDTNMTKDFEQYSNYPHIGIDSIEKNTGNILEYQLVNDSNLKSGKYLFDERHIIYSKIRPNINKVALPQFKGLCSADAYPILCRDGVADRNYLGYVLRSEFFLNYILVFSGRTNIPKVNKQQLKGFIMPTPPIALQNQFADFVNQVDKLKANVQKSLEETQLLFDSLIQPYFE